MSEEKSAGKTKALAGLRVVEFARYIAGPYCGMMLADLGADVVKVESPNGDPSRHEGPWIAGRSGYYAQMNRNKRGVVLDPRSKEGIARLRELLVEADVFIENFRPGVLDAMGLSPDALAELNPRLVVVSVSGFGQSSSIRDRPAFDAVLQVSTGLAWTTGAQGSDEPLMIGTYLVDVAAAMTATIGALAALNQRQGDGRGQHVDVTMLDAALAMMGPELIAAAANGEDPPRVGSEDRTTAPANVYRAQDGWVYVNAGGDAMWSRAITEIGGPDGLDHAELATVDGRLGHRDEVDAFLAAWVRGHDVDTVIATMSGAGVPAARVNTLTEALAEPDLAIQERLVTVRDGEGTEFPTLLAPTRLSRSPIDVEHGVPDLDQRPGGDPGSGGWRS